MIEFKNLSFRYGKAGDANRNRRVEMQLIWKPIKNHPYFDSVYCVYGITPSKYGKFGDDGSCCFTTKSVEARSLKCRKRLCSLGRKDKDYLISDVAGKLSLGSRVAMLGRSFFLGENIEADSRTGCLVLSKE